MYWLPEAGGFQAARAMSDDGIVEGSRDNPMMEMASASSSKGVFNVALRNNLLSGIAQCLGRVTERRLRRADLRRKDFLGLLVFLAIASCDAPKYLCSETLC